MGKTVYWMNVSLDMFIEHSTGENGGGDWLRIGEELHREFNRRARELEMMVQGRVVYEIMEHFWPRAAEDRSLPDYIQEYGRIWVETPKVLVSNIRRKADYDTTVIGGADVIDDLADLRARTAGNIGVGGANLATQLLRAGLLDELLLFTHPVILGSGRPLFDELDAPVDLEVAERGEFDDGVSMNRYTIRST